MKPVAGGPESGSALPGELRKRGVKGVLLQMAERGQLLELRCEMPSCYCPKGREHFDERSTPMPDWAPNPDHYPRLKSDGGKLEPGNVRLAHALCNREDYGWRTKIRELLNNKKTLQEIADELNRSQVRRPHGSPEWTPSLVRKSFVS